VIGVGQEGVADAIAVLEPKILPWARTRERIALANLLTDRDQSARAQTLRVILGLITSTEPQYPWQCGKI
jgi:hypothetical protein